MTVAERAALGERFWLRRENDWIMTAFAVPPVLLGAAPPKRTYLDYLIHIGMVRTYDIGPNRFGGPMLAVCPEDRALAETVMGQDWPVDRWGAELP